MKFCPCGNPAHTRFIGDYACKRCIEIDRDRADYNHEQKPIGSELECRICGVTFISKSSNAVVCGSVECVERNRANSIKERKAIARERRQNKFELS